MKTVAILILAAGVARRMRGVDKLLEPVGGQPLLRHLALQAVATGASVLVTLPPEATLRRDALSGLPLTVVEVPDASAGMSASLRAGVLAVDPGAGALLVLLADMPEIDRSDLCAMIDAHVLAGGATVVRAMNAAGTPGHPVLFPRHMFAALGSLSGDQGARDLLKRTAVRLIELPGDHATTDLDTPEAWASWRNKAGG